MVERFPHPFKVTKVEVTGAPPVKVPTVILEGMGNCQDKGIENENEAMQFDWVLYHEEAITDQIKAEYEIEVDIFGNIIKGITKKAKTGQLSKRIWFNNTSN